MSADERVSYAIAPADPGAHHFRVTVTVHAPDPAGQQLSIPAWIPGSYLVRDYARHVLEIGARCGDEPVTIEKAGKAVWRADACTGALTVELLVYAWDLSVRGAHLDHTHGYFNGCCVFPRVHGHDTNACRVTIHAPDDDACADWRVATSLKRVETDVAGFGVYEAADYDELIDHPVEMGVFDHVTFEACGVPHEIAITGRHRADLDRLCNDLSQLCEYHIRFFGEPAPIDRYVFLVMAVGDGYGGLEHRWSTSLMCRRDDLPIAGRPGVDKRYRRFLGLCSHEYFHLWNVKRMRPAAFARSDLAAEAPSRLLWVFEGITSYYDDLALVRSGLVDGSAYLKLLGETATRVEQSRGRTRQSLADSSFDAWIKLYKRDENTPNAIVSYYTKGALAALALDLTIRLDTLGRHSLDDVMRAMWEDYANPTTGLAEDAFERLARDVTGLDLGDFFDAAIRGTDDLPIESLLEQFGVQTVRHYEGDKPEAAATEPARAKAALEVSLQGDGDRVRLATVFEGGPAHAAGLAAGDELVALDGLRVTPSSLERMIADHDPGDRVALTAFRRDEMMTFDVTLGEAPRNVIEFRLADDVAEEVANRRDNWLGSFG